MTLASKVVLLVSSYAPLLMLFGLLESFGAGWPSTVCFVAAGGSVAMLALLWWTVRSTLASDNASFSGARSRDSEVMAYVVSYVVPFAAATNDDSETRWGLALFAMLIAVLYVRAAVFYVHPLLLLCGIHVYDVSREGVPAIVLTRQSYLRQECVLSVVTLSPNVYLEKT